MPLQEAQIECTALLISTVLRLCNVPDASFEWTIPGLPVPGEVLHFPHPDIVSPRVG
jgi:hypothetical protein